MKAPAWSWTSLEMFQLCPKKWYHLKFKKDVKDDFSGEAAEFGKYAHKAFEDRAKKGKTLPLDLRFHEKVFAKLDGMNGTTYVEQKLAINDSFEGTGYWDDDVFGRGQVDFLKVTPSERQGILIDWKTGKPKDNFGQVNMSAAILMANMPELEKLVVGYYWTRTKKVVRNTLTRDDLPALWDDVLQQVLEIQNAVNITEFPAVENGLCGWCPCTECPNWRDRSK